MRKGPYRETRSVMQVSTRRGGRHFAGRGVAGWWKVAFAIVLTAAMVLQSSNIQAIAGELLDPVGSGQVAGGEVEQQVADESVAEGLTEADGADETDAATETDATVETDGEQTAAGDVTEGDDAVADGAAAEGEPSEDVAAEPVDETVTEESTTPETQAETVASESASADGVEGRKISGTREIYINQVVQLTTNNSDKGPWYDRYEHEWSVSKNGVVSLSNANNAGVKVTGLSAGVVTITHTWGQKSLLGWWWDKESESFTITVLPGPSDGYRIYLYTMLPSVVDSFNPDADPDTMWNGMGVGVISGASNPAQLGTGVVYDYSNLGSGVSLDLPADFPDITYEGKTYSYAKTPEEALQSGHYTISWDKVVVDSGANAGANTHNPVIEGVNTYHLNGYVNLIDENLVQVSFHVQEPGSSSFGAPLEKYYLTYPVGTTLSEVIVPLPEDVPLTKEHDGHDYKFEGWYSDESCQNKVDFESEGTITQNARFYGKYVLNEGTLTYNSNNGTGETTSVTGTLGGTVLVAENTFDAPTGYEFAGWNTQADGQGKPCAAGDEYTLTGNDDVLYAQWTPKSNAWYVVNYLEQGTNTQLAPQKNVGNQVYGQKYEEHAISIPGYELVGNEVQEVTAGYDNNVINFYYKLNAQATVLVTYETTAGGSITNSSDTIQIVTAEGLTGSTAEAATGYKFDGWFKDGAEQPFTGGETLTAEVAKANLNTEKNGTYAATTFTARFSVDDGQTKDLSATVDYALGGVVQVDEHVDLKDTVQVLEPDTLSTAGVTAKEFAGWTLDSITINDDEVESLPAVVNDGDRVVYHYVADTSALSVSNYSGVYDGESHGITVNGLIEGDVVSYSVSNSFTDVTGSPVSVTATVARNGVAIWTGIATVSITPATIRVTISDATKVEGQVDPGLESTYVVPVAGELAGFEGSIAREPGEEPGTYVIGRGTLVLVDRAAQLAGEKDFKASNYTLEVVPGTFTITAAPGGGDNPGGGTDNPGGGTGTNPGGGAGGTNPGGAGTGTGTGAGTGTGTGAGTNPAPTPVTATADDDAAADDEAIDDDENPLADDASADDESDDAESIDDDSNPLASGTGSTAETCWVHWAVIVGIIVTVAYFAVCAARTRRATDELASFEDDVLDRR